ncbi:unnamed protein product [Closterium sp. NIES-54]
MAYDVLALVASALAEAILEGAHEGRVPALLRAAAALAEGGDGCGRDGGAAPPVFPSTAGQAGNCNGSSGSLNSPRCLHRYRLSSHCHHCRSLCLLPYFCNNCSSRSSSHRGRGYNRRSLPLPRRPLVRLRWRHRHHRPFILLFSRRRPTPNSSIGGITFRSRGKF